MWTFPMFRLLSFFQCGKPTIDLWVTGFALTSNAMKKAMSNQLNLKSNKHSCAYYDLQLAATDRYDVLSLLTRLY